MHITDSKKFSPAHPPSSTYVSSREASTSAMQKDISTTIEAPRLDTKSQPPAKLHTHAEMNIFMAIMSLLAKLWRSIQAATTFG